MSHLLVSIKKPFLTGCEKGKPKKSLPKMRKVLIEESLMKTFKKKLRIFLMYAGSYQKNQGENQEQDPTRNVPLHFHGPRTFFLWADM